MSLKLKLTALISLLVLILVLIVSGLYLHSFVVQTLTADQQIGYAIYEATYGRAHDLLASTRIPRYIDPKNTAEVEVYYQVQLSEDSSLRSLMLSSVSSFPSVEYVAITNTRGMVVAHNAPSMIGQPLPTASTLSQLLDAGFIRQLRLIYGAPGVYQVVFPLQLDQRPFCNVQIGISTVLLGNQVKERIKRELVLGAWLIVLATLTAALLSFRILRPLKTISQSVDRLARGEFSAPVKLQREDEWGALSGKLDLLGEQIRGDKATYLALRDNLDQLFANLVDGLMLFDQSDRLVLATASASRFLGIPTERLVHKPASEVFAGPGPLNELLRRAFQRRISLVAHPVNLQDNSEISRAAVSTHFVSEQGRQVASLVTLRDAGTRAQLQDQIGITTKLAAVGRLTSGVAHEVKNPLNAMILQVEILKAKLGEQDRGVDPQLKVLSEEIRRLDRVVKTFLDFTRPLEIRRSSIEVREVVREVFTLAEPHARKSNVRLVLEPNGDVPAVHADRDLIKQALLNVVLNGCQAMPEGGELRVAFHPRPGMLDLEVIDQGVGIPDQEHQKIFSLFHTTKPGGTGIGLAMAYRIVELHEGSIQFRSEVNHGTTFRISLPA
ncbi:MAG: sensor histidine kinase [Terriglobia bacterium]